MVTHETEIAVLYAKRRGLAWDRAISSIAATKASGPDGRENSLLVPLWDIKMIVLNHAGIIIGVAQSLSSWLSERMSGVTKTFTKDRNSHVQISYSAWKSG